MVATPGSKNKSQSGVSASGSISHEAGRRKRALSDDRDDAPVVEGTSPAKRSQPRRKSTKQPQAAATTPRSKPTAFDSNTEADENNRERELLDQLIEEELGQLTKHAVDGDRDEDDEDEEEEDEDEVKEVLDRTFIDFGELPSNKPQVSASELKRSREYLESAMTVIATKLQNLAKSVNPFGIPPERMGMTRVFWQFTKTASVSHLVEQYMGALEDNIVAAIGHSGLTLADILSVPRPSAKDLKKFGNYLGVVELPGESPKLYAGSSCNKSKGMGHRWRSYDSNLRTGTNPGKMAFVSEMLKPGAKNHIRALITADRAYANEPRMLTFESWHMIYFDTVCVGNWDDKFLAPPDMVSQWYGEVVGELRLAVSPNPFPWSGRGLNRIWSVGQQCRGLQLIQSERACANCTVKTSTKWFIDDGQPMQSYLCINCYDYRKKHGNDRTAAMEVARRENASLKDKRDDPCGYCGGAHEKRKNSPYLRRYKHKDPDTGEVFHICGKCMRLRKNNQGRLPDLD